MARVDLLVGLLLLVNVICTTSLQCHGRDNLDETQTLSCKTNSRLAELAKSQSCVRELLNNSDDYRCSTTDSCLEVNIQLKPGSFVDTDGTIWSFLSCYKTVLDVRICSDGAATTTTTQPTSPLTSTQTNPASRLPPKSGITDDAMTTDEDIYRTTTEEYPTTPNLSTTANPSTTASATSFTSSSALSANFQGCLTGSIQLDSTCTQLSYEIQLTDGNKKYSADLLVIDCCSNDDFCGSHTTIPPDTIPCRFGESTEVYCDSCWAYLLRNGEQTSTWYGCLADIPLTGSSFYGANSCTTSYETGACSDAGDEKECIRCCRTPNCNDAVIEIFVPQAGEGDDAVTHRSGFLLLILSVAAAMAL